MNCPDCHAENMDGAAVCWSCQTALTVKADPSVASRAPWVVLGVVIVVVVMMLLSAGSGAVSSGGGGAVATSTVTATGSVEPTVSGE